MVQVVQAPNDHARVYFARARISPLSPREYVLPGALGCTCTRVPVGAGVMVSVGAGVMVSVGVGVMVPVGPPLPCRGGVGVGSVISQSAYPRASLTLRLGVMTALIVLYNLRFFKPLGRY